MNHFIKKMTELVQQSFSLNLRVMRAFGLYPPDKHTKLYKIQGYFMYITCIIPVPLFGCLYLLLEENIDLERVADNAFLLAEMGCYITKFLPFLTLGTKIKKCIHYFESSQFKNRTNSQKGMIDACSRICRRNTRIFLFSVGCGYLSWAVKPLFWKHKRLPIDIWVPFNPTSDLKTFIAVYLYLLVAVAYAAFGSGVSDPLIAGLACQATGQLQVLKDNLQNLAKYADTYHKIEQCIDHHVEILNFVEDYEECFSVVVFSQFAGSVLVICVSCLQLTMMEPFSFNFFAMITYLVAMVSEIYLYCYYGTTLFEESNTLTEAIYMGKWYQYDMKSKKALVVLMERCKKPIVVTAGTVLDLSLVTFTTILRRSYSLLAVLNNYK